MATRPVTLQLPEKLYELYRQKAELSHRSVEEEVLEAVSAATPFAGLPAELARELESLKMQSDKVLWKTAAKSHLTARESQKLARLRHKGQTASLSPQELQTKEELLYQYEHRMVIRSYALFLLKERGFDVSPLLKVS